MPYNYGNPRRKFLASVFLTPSPDYYGFNSSARPSAVTTAMRRGGDDYNLYSASGSGSSRFGHTYPMRTVAKPTPPKVNYDERLYANREAESTSTHSTSTDFSQSSWAIRAKELQGIRQRASSADRASSIERTPISTERWKPVQDIRPSRMYLSSHIFSEPVTLIDMPVPERTFERSSSLAPRMATMPSFPSKRTYH
ncbi:unnamed protein product [Meganyctiphanes norvegica]|uniref:Uncharacterized protein n=1 Tax=Meganyctiphanes norvegica TaxID=48144 RepID=A0AAV2R945_MEGNR